MNLIDILLLEAIRINSGKEAYELIKNNKLGVKLDTSYKTADESIIPYFDKAINNVGINNATFTIQLLVNKVPTKQLKEVVDSDALKEIVSCKNKPWAKEIPGYKEVIDFSSKEKYNSEKWHDLEKVLQKEGENHGKATKGSGNLKDVKELYNNGTWTLQVPISWNGAKAASFYGKKNDRQTTTRWCTRTDKYYYDKYTEDNTKPLYIIRNWETGRSYQMAIRGNRVDFLDQDDVRGDEISKGDFTAIPDELLKKIPYGNNENMLDFKNEFGKANKELAEYKKNLKNIKANSKIKDPTNKINNARWGKTEKVTSKVSKNVFLNYYDLDNPKVENPLSKAKGFDSAFLPSKLKNDSPNENGWNSNFIRGNKVDTFNHKIWAVKYYFNDDPKNFIVLRAKPNKIARKIDPELRASTTRSKEKFKDMSFGEIYGNNRNTVFATNYDFLLYAYDENTGKTKKVKDDFAYQHYSTHSSRDLMDIAFKDFGADKTYDRNVNNTNKKSLENLNNITEETIFKKSFEALIDNGSFPFLKKVSSKKWTINVLRGLSDWDGKIIPYSIDKTNDEVSLVISIKSSSDPGKYMEVNISKKSALNYHVESIDPSEYFEQDIKKYGEDKVKKELEYCINKTMKDYLFKAIKDKDLKNIRMANRRRSENDKNDYRKTSLRLQLENVNYFPY